MPRHSPVSPDRARSREPAAWLPARLLPLELDRGGPDQGAAQGARRCGPPGAGTGVPTDSGLGRRTHVPYSCLTSIVPSYSRCGWSSATLDGLLITGGLDG